ncbi:sigma-70 family RNA polymerase sigma factor [candidate division KSB1 bacterium]|nr:sigma-70 family RNA polymerase sigma factor [candidate division KSB1 bacterium]
MAMLSKFFAELEERRLVAVFLSQRNEQAFRRLYRCHTPHLYRVAMHLAGGIAHEAEEIVQEAWVRAVERLPQFRWESRLQTWLVGIVVNRSRELFRQRRKQQSEISAEALEERASPGGAEDGESLDLERAIAMLPEGYREILVLHDVEGYTHVEIGALLGIEAGTSKSQLFHARRVLRAALRS